jgi:CheY-like chemotaxis protein
MEKKRILIIDDDVSLTQMLQLNLVDTGKFEVGVCNQALQALDTAREFHPDIILLDVVMPGLDGGDVDAQLKKDPFLRDVPVLIITALVSSEEVNENSVVESGDQVMLSKPIRFEKLLQAIESSLSGNL